MLTRSWGEVLSLEHTNRRNKQFFLRKVLVFRGESIVLRWGQFFRCRCFFVAVHLQLYRKPRDSSRPGARLIDGKAMADKVLAEVRDAVAELGPRPRPEPSFPLFQTNNLKIPQNPKSGGKQCHSIFLLFIPDSV